jgi:hypothetical protein
MISVLSPALQVAICSRSHWIAIPGVLRILGVAIDRGQVEPPLGVLKAVAAEVDEDLIVSQRLGQPLGQFRHQVRPQWLESGIRCPVDDPEDVLLGHAAALAQGRRELLDVSHRVPQGVCPLVFLDSDQHGVMPASTRFTRGLRASQAW